MSVCWHWWESCKLYGRVCRLCGDAAGVDFDIVIPPPPHDYRVHHHGLMVHAHFVRIDQPEHDHRADKG